MSSSPLFPNPNYFSCCSTNSLSRSYQQIEDSEQCQANEEISPVTLALNLFWQRDFRGVIQCCQALKGNSDLSQNELETICELEKDATIQLGVGTSTPSRSVKRKSAIDREYEKMGWKALEFAEKLFDQGHFANALHRCETLRKSCDNSLLEEVEQLERSIRSHLEIETYTTSMLMGEQHVAHSEPVAEEREIQMTLKLLCEGDFLGVIRSCIQFLQIYPHSKALLQSKQDAAYYELMLIAARDALMHNKWFLAETLIEPLSVLCSNVSKVKVMQQMLSDHSEVTHPSQEDPIAKAYREGNFQFVIDSTEKGDIRSSLQESARANLQLLQQMEQDASEGKFSEAIDAYLKIKASIYPTQSPQDNQSLLFFKQLLQD